MTDIKNLVDVLFHADLAEREFGSALLSVSRLTTWAQDRDLELVTVPPLAGYRFVQAEALLCAIERSASSLKPEQAAKIVQADPVLSKDMAATDPDGYIDPIRCCWLLGADAHLSWRRLLKNAIEKQELTLLNVASKLPIQAAQTPQADTQPPAVPVEAAPGVEAPESREQRQDRRLKACEDAKLLMPASSSSRLPDGAGRIAALEGVTRQAFTADVKAALRRREAIVKPGRVVRCT